MSIEKRQASDEKADTCVSAQSHPPSASTQDDPIKRLTQIWQELLGIRSIEPDQSYFDLGGDSIFAVQLLTQIEHEFGVRLPLASFFDAPTIRELAQVLSRAKSASPVVD